eukprot:scaffold16024_cov258-Ochromonas_danica.AAC.4
MDGRMDFTELSKSTEYFKMYQKHRVATIKAELKRFENDHINEWNAQQSNDPYSKGSHPFAAYFNLSYWLLQGEFQMWGSTLPSTEDSLQCFTAICESFVSDLQRILAPFIAENQANRGGTTSNPVIRQSKMLLMRLDLLSILNQTYEDYRDLCHPDARRESAASIALNQLRQSLISSGVKAMGYLLSSALSEGFEVKKKESDESNACDLHPVTGNVLYCCKELLSNFSLAYKRMVEMGSTGGLLSGLPVSIPSDTEDTILALLDNLFVTLEHRADKFDEGSKSKAIRRSLLVKNHNLFACDDNCAEELVLSARKHLFLANNLHAMWTYIKDRRDGVEDRMPTSGNSSPPRPIYRAGGTGGKGQKIATLADKVEAQFRAEQDLFCETISIALGLGVQDMSDFQSLYAKDKANQSRILKAKFMVFNTGLEALLTQQGEWRVSSSGLRDSLSEELVGRIAPTYSQFFNTYSTIRFSKKHMHEYVKFNPTQVESQLRGFFGRTK